MVKQSKIITQQLKTIESLNIIDIKVVTIEHPSNSCKLSNYINISVFAYENKEKYSMSCVKNTFKRHNDLLLIEEGKRHYVLIKDFKTFMYDHTFHRGSKHFCRYCLQAFSTAEESYL